jgi:glucose-6-phosphate isomerase
MKRVLMYSLQMPKRSLGMLNTIYFKTTAKERHKERLFGQVVEEKKSIGYYTLPEKDVSDILAFANTFDEEVKDIVVLGIGGSSLGSRAVYNFIRPTKQKMKRKLHFFESTDPINIAATIRKFHDKKVHYLVISKSGGTVETISIFKYLYATNSASSAYTFITDEGSNLDKFAKSIGSKVFYLAPNVGGRFSVLSAVGLVPLALGGVDIEALLQGAKNVSRSFFNKSDLTETMLNKAYFYAKNYTQFNINCLFAYSEALTFFTEWYVQLWGESLGKEQLDSVLNIGATPIGLIGPKDQHSFLQLIMDGARDKTVTFIKIKNFEHELYIPAVKLPHLESLEILDNVAFHELINMQCDSVMEALQDNTVVPLDVIELDDVSEKSVGELIYYYELLTSMVGLLKDINTYDQPGVEAGKIILKEKLKES